MERNNPGKGRGRRKNRKSWKVPVGILAILVLVAGISVAGRAGAGGRTDQKNMAEETADRQGKSEKTAEAQEHEESETESDTKNSNRAKTLSESLLQEDRRRAEGEENNTEDRIKKAAAINDSAERKVKNMMTEEKVAQLFIITPEQLTGYEKVTRAKEATKDALKKYPVGGLIYFSENLQNEEQVKELTKDTKAIAEELGILPLFLALDEEGGEVVRLARRDVFSVPKVPLMSEIGATGDVNQAREAGDTIGAYLQDYGFNLDFAPDADVLTNPENKVVKKRSFGSDPGLVTRMTEAYLDGLESHGVCGVPKHFPGHGATAEDSHEGFAYVDKTWEQLEEADLVPFRACVKRQVPFIMSGHISLPEITGEDIPCSLSPLALKGYLRDTMGYEGIIITDALGMGAIQNHYDSAEAAVLALEAGADMLLMPASFQTAYEGVTEAVRQGRISEERLEESVIRIVRVKQQYFPEAFEEESR